MEKRYSLSTILFDTGLAHRLENLSDEEFWNYAAELASTRVPPASPPAEPNVLCAIDHEQHYLLPMDGLVEVLALPTQYTSLPSTPVWMPGITIWRNEVIPLINLAAYLQQEETDTQANFMAVASFGEITLGLLIKLIDYRMAQDLHQPGLPDPQNTLPICPMTIQGVQDGAFMLDMSELITTVAAGIQEPSYA